MHGLGFAGALRDVGIPAGRLPLALASFNVGVEIGQLVVVLALWLVVARLKERSWYRPRVLAIASVALFVVGSAWAVERAGVLEVARAVLGNAKVAPVAKSGDAGRESPARAAENVPAPLVVRLCQSLSELPRVRRAECTHTNPGISLANQCTRLLGASVKSGAVLLVEPEAERCLTDWDRRYEGCDFIEQASLPRPSSCERVLVGNLGLESTCRSSIECSSGLQCDGVGPMESGHCRPPRDEGASCGLAVDPLLGYVSGIAGDRRECSGVCLNNHCVSNDAQIARRR